MESPGKFCPVCKNKNEQEAVICKHCGAPLKYHKPSTGTVKVDESQTDDSKLPEELQIDEAIIPNNGIAVYFAGTTKPNVILTDKEFIIGRKVVATSEVLLDLSEFDGFRLGLSRRHAMIRQANSGYEIIDLSSTNGTWLNDERLVPYTPYPLTSGSQLRLSRMRLFVFFRSQPEE